VQVSRGRRFDLDMVCVDMVCVQHMWDVQKESSKELLDI
jgi:hypothetical protein